jgi:hypothetical protein
MKDFLIFAGIVIVSCIAGILGGMAIYYLFGSANGILR